MTEYHLIGCCHCQPVDPTNPTYKKPFLSMTTEEQIREVLELQERIVHLQEKIAAQQKRIEELEKTTIGEEHDTKHVK